VTRCARLSSRLGLDDRVRFIDRLGDDQMAGYFRSLDVFMLPTRREGFGMVFAEAMSQETPAIGPRQPPVDEIIADGETGCLVDDGTAAAYAAAALSLLDDPAKRRTYGAARAPPRSRALRRAPLVRADRRGLPAPAGGARVTLAVKRALDAAAAGAGLLALSPLLAAIALAIKIESPRLPLFFNDTVMGRDGTRFRMFKFRTMLPHTDRLRAPPRGDRPQPAGHARRR
jgi:hypothetical protein